MPPANRRAVPAPAEHVGSGRIRNAVWPKETTARKVARRHRPLARAERDEETRIGSSDPTGGLCTRRVSPGWSTETAAPSAEPVHASTSGGVLRRRAQCGALQTRPSGSFSVNHARYDDSDVRAGLGGAGARLPLVRSGSARRTRITRLSAWTSRRRRPAGSSGRNRAVGAEVDHEPPADTARVGKGVDLGDGGDTPRSRCPYRSSVRTAGSRSSTHFSAWTRKSTAPASGARQSRELLDPVLRNCAHAGRPSRTGCAVLRSAAGEIGGRAEQSGDPVDGQVAVLQALLPFPGQVRVRRRARLPRCCGRCPHGLRTTFSQWSFLFLNRS
ncbi:hypothetical protein S1361_21080 [Streptomyces cyanogenus]|uniref:Uncharacterized protein n=1 Tax=Streptomyces cyanogenus TaxID=80860 RepID=A0ABX7TSX6_STRCY|nr:hypothetical protein S1361_21080 [Streptomyces cyanogenus]